MPQAVLFTHIKERERLSSNDKFLDFDVRRRPFFRHCLECPNVGVVFVYSSYGVEEYVASVDETAIPLDVLDNEQRLYDALQLVVDNAAADIDRTDPEGVKDRGPKFVFIGMRELACHLVRLKRHDPRLIQTLASKGRFTYDSPKYAEAIIRLVRARGEFAEDPVIRIDADVEVNRQAIQKIVDKATRSRDDSMWWFSGSYRGSTSNDPVNTYAVRQHWLVDPDTWGNPRRFSLVKGGEHFLYDLAELGATQIEANGPVDLKYLSEPTQQLIKQRGFSKNRGTPQVISGAGLVASRDAIQRLPPFMNAPAMVIWIDDHLKRLLHETIGDLTRKSIERVRGARLKQNRFPDGIKKRDIDLARTDYFERLLTGCLMEATIQHPDGKRGPLAEIVLLIVDSLLRTLDGQREEELRAALIKAAEVRFEEVMSVWQHAEYGNDELQKWAKAYDKKDDICNLVGAIGISYAELCIDWPQHVAAIEQLNRQEAYWAFTRARRPLPVQPSAIAPASQPRLPVRASAPAKPAKPTPSRAARHPRIM